ncbi:MAG: hypothetical protein ABIS03_06115, partial [Gemmatimonadaceae bacterium]
MKFHARWTVALGAIFLLGFAAPAGGRAQAVSGAASKTATSAPSRRILAAKVDEYLDAAMKVRRFAGTVLIARNGQPLVSKGYGMANIEDGAANTPQT